MKKIKKSKTKEKKEASVRDEIRGLGVLIEHVDGNIGLIAEQYSEIKQDSNEIKKDTTVIKKTLDTHTEMIGKLAVDMEIVKTDIELIKHSFKKKIDIDEFAASEKRVLLLEKRR